MSIRQFFSSSRKSDTTRESAAKRVREESETDSDSDICELLSESETSSRTAESATTSHSSNSGKQSKTFHSSWRHGRPWLKYVADVQGMFCSLCQKYNKLPYNRDYWNKSPCRRIRLSSITKHEESAAHVECVKREASSTLNPRTNIAAAMNPPVPQVGMQQGFTCLYFLAKQRIAQTTNYEPLLNLAGLLGVNIKEKIRVAKNAVYTSDKTIQDMIFVISDVIEKAIISEMKRRTL